MYVRVCVSGRKCVRDNFVYLVTTRNWQTYMIFTEFLEAKAVATTRGKIREEFQMAKHTQSNDGGLTPPIPATIAASTTAAGDGRVDGRPKTNQSRSSKASKVVCACGCL